MMFRSTAFQVTLLAVLGIWMPAGSALEGTTLQVAEAAICSSVQDLTCIDQKEQFVSSVGRLYCLTRIDGAGSGAEVRHVWFFGEEERARVPLSIRSDGFRTYSSKTIQEHETGGWRVEVQGPGGSVLETMKFEVVP
jgi:hypothetical protein